VRNAIIVFILISIAPPALYFLGFINVSNTVPIILSSLMGLMACTHAIVVYKLIYTEKYMIEDASEKYNIPKEDFEIAYHAIYHENSGISKERRLEATLKYFNVSGED